ncbi:MAG: acyl carrier protein [Pseudomonadota bacterium]
MALETTKIYERLTPIFRDVFDDDDVTPNEEMTAADVSAWDSLSNIRLVVAVEEEFRIQFSTGEVAGLKNVGEFVRVIQSRASE